MRIVATFLGIFTILGAFAQESADRINFAHHYNLDEAIRLAYYSGLMPDHQMGVIIAIDGGDQEVRGEDYLFSFKNIAGYEASLDAPQLAPTLQQQIAGNSTKIIYQFSFNPLNQPLLLCEVRNVVTGITYFIDFRKTDKPLPEILVDPVGFPTVNSFMNEGRYAIKGASSIDVDVYEFDFPPAQAPMSTSPAEVSRTMDLSASFSMDSTYDHIFDSEGLYVGRNSDNKIQMVYRIQGPYYPQYVTVPDLIDPLVYITTRSERTNLERNVDDKKVFDRFWLELTGSKERAKWIIKNYYDRITEANLLFTSYKEGWKTDRGMMYIVFGPPDEVIRNEFMEIWYYEKGLENEKLMFSFKMIDSPYADRQYVLDRNEELSQPWMAAVKYWRQGMPIKDM